MVQPADTPEPGRAPNPPNHPTLRIGDAERQAVVERLQAALNEGRLEMHEFEERSAAAYAAKTEVDLHPLTADLPLVPKTPRDPNAAEVVVAAGKKRGLTGAEQGWLRVAIILTAIWLVQVVATGGNFAFFWPIWPIGIWGAVLLAQRLTGGHRD
jgi:hypothetical protein